MSGTDDTGTSTRMRWARFRFSVVGPLLASPPEHGELAAALAELAQRSWRHPTTGEAVRFAVSTLERWLYLARHDPNDPVGALARKVHARAGLRPSVGPVIADAIAAQHRAHPRWSVKLHHDNLVAQVAERPELGEVPSYTTLTRFMKERGLIKLRLRRRRPDAPALVERETRSFEVAHVHGLWHLDFHDGSRRVLEPDATYHTPVLFGCLDDRSRLSCHLQWYLVESAQTLCHGLSQAILKRGLPRALLTDNGGAMLADETTAGLARLGIVHHTTLARHPQQNGKQESFWGQVEGRLIAMLEGEPELTLSLLNQATQAWLELEYHRAVHRELGASPLDVFTTAPSVGRPAPAPEVLRRAFRTQQTRTQRRSDGTISVEGVRFEVPSVYRTLLRPTVRFARWDLSSIDLVDPHTDALLATLHPLDKRQNADRRRRVVPPAAPREPMPAPAGIAPHLRRLMADYAATGLPPAYLPLGGSTPDSEETDA
jgi:putative transposase